MLPFKIYDDFTDIFITSKMILCNHLDFAELWLVFFILFINVCQYVRITLS